MIKKNEGTMDGGREGGIKRRGKKERKKEVMGGWGRRETGWGEREREGERGRKGTGNLLLNVNPVWMLISILNPLGNFLLFYRLLYSISQNISLHTPRAL